MGPTRGKPDDINQEYQIINIDIYIFNVIDGMHDGYRTILL